MFLAGIDKEYDFLSHVSDVDHRMRSLNEFANWTGYDFHTFISTAVGTLLADHRILMDDKLYDVLRYLSNMDFFMLQMYQTREDQRGASENTNKFSSDYKRYFGPEACTWKFHMSQHMQTILELFGCAAFTDNFVLERTIGTMVKRVTSRRNQIQQLTSNFLLQHHNEPFLKRGSFHEKTRDFLNEMGVKTAYAYGDECKTVGRGVLENFAKMDSEPRLQEFYSQYPECLGKEVRVVEKTRKGNVCVTSEKFQRRGKARDNYILLNRQSLYEVKDIVEVKGEGGVSDFFMKLDVLEKSAVKADAFLKNPGNSFRSREWPEGQFPVNRMNARVWKKVEEGDVFQKLFYGKRNYLVKGVETELEMVVVHVNPAY